MVRASVGGGMRGAGGGEGCQTAKGCGQRDCPARATPNGVHAERRVWPQLHLPNEGGRSRASCPMDGATITVKYLLIGIPTTDIF